MRYLSVCSGIEAATVAWHGLGWTPAAFAEIDRFPSQVLAHHYPAVPNHGDFTTIEADTYGAIDLLVGGTPCQAFSVAGKRAGLDDPRGNLTIEFARLAGRLRPRWLVWENVPGVLSIDGGRTFGAFLGILGQLGYRCGYRVLDAQYFGVPQRRRRVFVVGHLGDWRRAAAVLFERHSLSGHPAPRREAGQNAPTLPSRGTGGGGLGTLRANGADFGGGSECLIASDVAPTLDGRSRRSGAHSFATSGGLIASTGDTSHCLNAGGMGRQDYETETLIAHSLRADGFDASEDGTGRGTPLVAAYAIQERAACENPDAGPDGAGFRDDGTSYTLESRRVPQAVAFNLRGRDGGAMPECDDLASLRAASGGSSRSYVAGVSANQRGEVREREVHGSPNGSKSGKQFDGIMQGMLVRRLTPRECERLQGFPDDYTKISEELADAPRYKALGNSMAVPVMRWLGERIQQVEEVTA